MLLSDLFKTLTYGELSQLSFGGVEDSGIQEEDYPRIISHIQLGLTELYKRFPLRIEEIIIQQEDHIQTYYLEPQFAQTNTESTEPYKYIMDSEYQPFKNNVLKIERVFNEQGEELFTNDDAEYWSVHTPTYNSIQVPYPEKENAMSVEYRANHPKIIIGPTGEDTLNQEINISGSHLEALLYYVGARVYATNPSLAQAQDGMTYMGKFEASCQKIAELNLINKDNRSNQKLYMRGFV
jgi:hypothetical protein